ncbi:hypothetical protein MMIC_P1047 [Mariprofundus micogutta]|uniref:Uncharacterized protein n=1 Tax=Mariprofundus micogutta TaxID=1921010 RepID=A0A1L8CMF7_9PROT|nr:hypothetical protein [Mariprofundus micogutta]GAV20085.1 hypothetical protein MMIC_P1047 [Mariprofundus micogutta]
MASALPESEYKSVYGYKIDPIYDEYTELGNISEVSDAAILTSISASIGICTLVSLMIP